MTFLLLLSSAAWRGLALHEDAVAAEDRRGAVTLDDLLLLEVDLGIDAEAAHDPGDRIPGHLHKAGVLVDRSHPLPLSVVLAPEGAESGRCHQLFL
jgi:hypothetical protein